MCRTINSITDNPIVGAYAHVISGAYRYERFRVVEIGNDRRSCVVENETGRIRAVKEEAEGGIWRWSVPGVKVVINFTNVPEVGFIAEHEGPEGELIRTTVVAVSEDGTEVTMANGATTKLAPYGGYPFTRFRVAR